jgi:hypothetical protein
MIKNTIANMSKTDLFCIDDGSNKMLIKLGVEKESMYGILVLCFCPHTLETSWEQTNTLISYKGQFNRLKIV